LSAGVVQLMEIRPAATREVRRAEAPARIPAAKGQREQPKAMLWRRFPDVKQLMPLDPASLERERRATLRESFLRLDLDPGPAPEPKSEPELETGPERDLSWMRESKLEAVPEPGSFVLVAIGVAALSARRRSYWRISSSSTSKTRTAPGGIRPAPRSP
jgi:hypothetical protein